MNDGLGCFGVLVAIGLICLIIGIASNPGLEKAKKYVEANDILVEHYQNSYPGTKICRKNKLIMSDFYFKKPDKRLYYVGDGSLWMLKISRDSFKEVGNNIILTECAILK